MIGVVPGYLLGFGLILTAVVMLAARRVRRWAGGRRRTAGIIRQQARHPHPSAFRPGRVRVPQPVLRPATRPTSTIRPRLPLDRTRVYPRFDETVRMPRLSDQTMLIPGQRVGGGWRG